MPRPNGHGFLRDDSGAVAVTYALALTGLIVVAGVGFDFGRLAAMDSELQNGADQAALAGATQLDGRTGACARAAAAAVNLVSNPALTASGNQMVTVASEPGCDAAGNIKFWQDRDKSTAATSDANARFIEVTVDSRSVDYAFTAIAGALYGTATATALAGLGSSICKVPPVFICNPNEASDPNFNVTNYIGKGIRLIANDGGSNYAPGNFGYLQTNAGNGAQATAQTLGRENIPGDCVDADSITTKPGEQVSVLDALNTRFDVYANGLNQVCGASNELCPPSMNSRKDLMHRGNASSCQFASGNGAGWREPDNPYRPTLAAPLTAAQIANTAPMGYPRDMCHAVSVTGSCVNGIIGNGEWDRNAYFKTNSANYPATFDYNTIPKRGATLTRYDVYRYEAANAATRLLEQSSGGLTARPQPYCRQPGVAVGGAAVDRRVLSVAVVNCRGQQIQGSTPGIQPAKWIDVFLVEPSVARSGPGGTKYTEQSDVYVEVIGATTLGGGSSAAQKIRRDVPYLVR